MKKPVWGLLLLLAACRPDPGPADYSGQELPDNQNPDGGTQPSDLLPGPFPYEAGKARLMVGIFYETGRSQEYILDNVDSNFYLYENTVYVESDPDHVEGKSADRIVQNGKPWMGFGVHWKQTHNFDAWKTLHVSMKSSDAAFANVKVGMSSGTGTNEKGYQLALAKYGWANDGEWHHLAIPVADYVAAGLKLNDVSSPFTFAAEGGTAGQSLLLDNLYFTAD
ncbi:putative glycoside hydrolase [Corallococcus interemptor]|uniref:putative glycoside hydrolase n=1 Tax=Corallococcus interemptor TaxID=2316720 RepID=UPI003D035F6B